MRNDSNDKIRASTKCTKQRRKNNEAAKRSREEKLAKEIAILEGAVGLTEENKDLKRKLEEAEFKIAELEQRLSFYEDQEKK